MSLHLHNDLGIETNHSNNHSHSPGFSLPPMHTSEVIASHSQLNGAVLHDLEQQRSAAAEDVRRCRLEVERETETLQAAGKSEIERLDAQQEDITQIHDALLERELALLPQMLAAQNEADEAEQRKRAPRKERLEARLETTRQALAAQEAADKPIIQQRADELSAQKVTQAKAFAMAGLRSGKDESIRPVQPELDSVAIEKEGVLLDSADANPVPAAVSWPICSVSGIAAGFSLALAAHFVHPETIHREVPIACVFSLFGIATSVALKFGLESLWREVSVRIYQPGRRWLLSAGVAIFAMCLVMAIYSTVEMRGLMSGMILEMMMQNIRGGVRVDPSQIQIAGRFGSLFLTVPYCLMIAASGFRKGRYAVNYCRAKAICAEAIADADLAQRQSPAVQDAFCAEALTAALQTHLAKAEDESRSAVGALKAEIADLERQILDLISEPTPPNIAQQRIMAVGLRIAAQRKRLDEKVNAIEARRRELASIPGLATPAKARLKDAEARHKYLGDRIEFEIAEARQKLEPPTGNLFQRIRQAIRPPKPSVGRAEVVVAERAA